MTIVTKSIASLFTYALVLLFSVSNLFGGLAPDICTSDQDVNEFTILSYHEVATKSETLDDTYRVLPKNFELQMKWLLDNGYHFVSIDDILAHKANKKDLPSNAILVTFDDGYETTYKNAYPILKKYKIPSVIAVVGSWLKEQKDVDFGGHMIPRSKFLTKKQIKEMVQSGLVEIGSHSFQSHEGVIGNPQGSSQPALTTRMWLSDKNRYEDDKAYKKRVFDDLYKSKEFITEYCGKEPRVIAWPYGRYNIETRKIAEELGMNICLTLDDGSNTKNTPLWGLRRILVSKDMNVRDLEQEILRRSANFIDDDRTTKAAHIDLDYIYDPNPIQTEKNLEILLNRLNDLGVNTVYLQAFADPDANGAANYVYFPNRHIPMKADLFNRAAWQIAKCTQVKRIYAWMPMLAWELPSSNPVSKDKVITLQVDTTHLNMGYPRLSPFSQRARAIIKDIYEDLAKSSYFDGILFHDDVTLSDFEDDSTFARDEYKKWGLDESVMDIRKNRDEFLRWTRLKTSYLDNFAKELASIVNNEQPQIKTARNLYAQVALNKDAQEWYSQSLSESIKNYDYTAIMSMPYMEQAKDHKAFYSSIVQSVKDQKCGLQKSVIEIQSVDWRENNKPLSPSLMSETMEYLYSLGVNHIAYYPDNLFKNVPDAATMRDSFSKKSLFIHSLRAYEAKEIKNSCK